MIGELVKIYRLDMKTLIFPRSIGPANANQSQQVDPTTKVTALILVVVKRSQVRYALQSPPQRVKGLTLRQQHQQAVEGMNDWAVQFWL